MKTFYYNSKDYMNRDYTETYIRVSRRIKIRWTLSGDPYFLHNGIRYKLDRFMRTENGCNIISADNENVVLCGYDSETYYKPYFIEIDVNGDYVRLYEYQGSETRG